MWNGKKKALTFSYDDGVLQDLRLIEIFNRYGLKGTFNLNSEFLGRKWSLVRNDVKVCYDKVEPQNVKTAYAGHEVAAHTLTHPFLPNETEEEIIRQVEEDRIKLSELCGYEVLGMAYPGGGINHDKRVEDIVRGHTGIRYARTTDATGNFRLQDDLICFNPTVYHIDVEKMFVLGEEFLALQPETSALFYVWGHSYEFDAWKFWDRFEEFCKMMGGHDDIFYGTNREVLL